MDQRVVISVDGGRTRIRRPKKGKPRQTTNRHGYVGDWREPKLLTIYVVDEQGKRVNTNVLPVTNDGTFGDVEPRVCDLIDRMQAMVEKASGEPSRGLPPLGHRQQTMAAQLAYFTKGVRKNLTKHCLFFTPQLCG